MSNVSMFRRKASGTIPSAASLIRNQILLDRLKREKGLAKTKGSDVVVKSKEQESAYHPIMEERKFKRSLLGFKEWCKLHAKR